MIFECLTIRAAPLKKELQIMWDGGKWYCLKGSQNLIQKKKKLDIPTSCMITIIIWFHDHDLEHKLHKEVLTEEKKYSQIKYLRFYLIIHKISSFTRRVLLTTIWTYFILYDGTTPQVKEITTNSTSNIWETMKN